MRLKLPWRMLTILVLIVYVLLLFGTIWLIAHSLVFAIILALTVLVLIYSGWLVLTGSGTRKAIGWGIVLISGVVLLLELINFLSEPANRRALLVLAILTGIYLALFGLLRKNYWALARRDTEQRGDTAAFMHPYLIVNPKSGDGRAIKAHIPEIAHQKGIQVLMTRQGGNVEDIALEAVESGADVLGISGGDGSIGAVAKIAMQHDLPIVVLPGGTRCHFARDLGLDPKRIVDALSGFNGVERRIDAGEINGRIFLNNASFGLYADIVDHPEYREHKLQVSRETLSSLVQGNQELYDLQFSHGTVSFDSAAMVLVGINRYESINLLELGHRPRLDEGLLQVTAITKLDDRLVRQLLRDMTIPGHSNFDDLPGIYQWTDTSFVVDSSTENLVVGVDGEREEYDTPVQINILPGALRVYVPAEGERNRHKNPLGRDMIRHEWEAVRGTKLQS